MYTCDCSIRIPNVAVVLGWLLYLSILEDLLLGIFKGRGLSVPLLHHAISKRRGRYD